MTLNRMMPPTYARLERDGNDLVWSSSYDAALVAAFKSAVPASDRRWDAGRKRWIISATYGASVAALCEKLLGVSVSVPAIASQSATPEIKVITLEYLGACKERGPSDISAMGFAEGAWSVVIPESVLKSWFLEPLSTPSAPAGPTTLYSLLGTNQGAGESDLKSAYRRMARQWHPDVCKEADATSRFQAINAAYETLKDPLARRKYDAGLKFMASLEQPRRDSDPFASLSIGKDYGYRAPLRCGLLMVDATPKLGRWHVATIHSWDDVTNNAGEILVTSWDKDRETIIKNWVKA